MCSHPDHKVTALPGGQVAEFHVIDEEQMAKMLEAFRRREPLTFVQEGEPRSPYTDMSAMNGGV